MHAHVERLSIDVDIHEGDGTKFQMQLYVLRLLR